MRDNLGSLFEQVVENFPDNSAIVYSEENKITYKELNALSNDIISLFQGFELEKGDVVIIGGDKSALMFASIIASIKTGIIYSIFDLDQPEYRFTGILDQCRPSLVISPDTKFFDVASKHNVNYQLFSEIINTCDLDLDYLQSNSPGINDLVYIVFTSGSTGVPMDRMFDEKEISPPFYGSIMTFFCQKP